MENITMAIADTESGILKIYGNPPDKEIIKKRIEELGYGFKDTI